MPPENPSETFVLEQLLQLFRDMVSAVERAESASNRHAGEIAAMKASLDRLELALSKQRGIDAGLMKERDKRWSRAKELLDSPVTRTVIQALIIGLLGANLAEQVPALRPVHLDESSLRTPTLDNIPEGGL